MVIQRMPSPNFDFRYISDVAITFPWGPAPREITAVHLFSFTLRNDIPKTFIFNIANKNASYIQLFS